MTNKMKTLAVRSSVKAGSLTSNHNQVGQKLAVKTAVKAGIIAVLI